MKSKTLITGVGNPFRHDDGIGPAIIKILQQENNSSFDLIDSGTDSLALLDKLAFYDKATIIDAAQMMEAPGTIKQFTPEEAKIKIKGDVLSTHGVGLAEMFALMQHLNIKTKIKIIGVQPKDISYGEGLSNEVQDQIPQILKLIKQEYT